MSDYQKELVIADIIARKETEVITPDEQEALDFWLRESEENRAFFEKISGRDSVVAYELAAANIDPEKILKGAQRKVVGKKRRKLRIRIASSAAVIAAGLLAFVLYTNDGGSSLMDMELLADRTQAVLVLPDGRQVDLNAAEDDDISWRKYVDATGHNAIAATVNIKIDIPRGGEYRIKLDDGTVVWLNSETTLEYPREFAGEKRTVRLTGEAYFEVARDEQRPFIVAVDDTEITVLGTSFNVAAYGNENTVTTTLISGSVEVATPRNSVTLIPGNQAVVSGNNDITITDVDPSLYSSWMTDSFVFEGMKLADICARLSRWYDVEFAFEDNTGEEVFSGGAWKDAPLRDFLANIELATDVKFTESKGRIIVCATK